MPNKNGMGPEGRGPKTGRGLGNCNGGGGQGNGRGLGCRRGRGYRQNIDIKTENPE